MGRRKEGHTTPSLDSNLFISYVIEKNRNTDRPAIERILCFARKMGVMYEYTTLEEKFLYFAQAKAIHEGMNSPAKECILFGRQ